MGLLNRFFHSPELRTQDLVADEAVLLQMWNNYVASTKEKGDLIAALSPGETLRPTAEQLKTVLASELVKTTAEQKTEEDLLKELRAIKHEEHIQRVKRLEYTLCYAETKYEYIHQLLKELWQILNRQLHIVDKLITGTTQDELLIHKLKESWAIEQHILTQISERETFHQLFVDLMKGEHVIARLTARQKRGISLLDRKMSAEKGLLREWVNAVYVGISDAVSNALAQGELDNIDLADYQFVNSPAFVSLVRTSLLSIRRRKQEASEQSVTVFVHLFREWYNSRLKL